MEKIIDISDNQGVIDWQQVSKHIGFAILRSVRGSGKLDYQFKERNGQQGENGDSLEKLLGCGGDGCRTVKKLHNGDHGGCCQCHGNGHS